jgi:hypothetical protein
MNIKDITLHDLFRYGYGGFVLAIVAAWVNPCTTKQIVDSLGSVVAPMAAFGMGAAVYVLFRAILGNGILFYILVVFFEGYYWPKDSPCKYRYLNDKLSLIDRPAVQSPFYARQAFRLIRDAELAFEKDTREQFHREHSEMQLIYLTAFVLLLGAIWDWRLAGGQHTWMLGGAALLWIVGMFNDRALDKREYLQLKQASDSIVEMWRAACKRAGLSY